MALLVTRLGVSEFRWNCRAILLPALPTVLFAIAISLFPCLSRAADQKPDPLPTPGELRRMFDNQQYQDLLAKLTRVVNLKGAVAAPYDHVEMELLRAESLFELKQRSAALPAYAHAVKLIDDNTDPVIAIRARATQVLIKRATAYLFTPKTSATRGEQPAPIDLLDMAQRKSAMVALLRDLQAEATPKMKAAAASKTLPPIIDAIKWLTDYRSVEQAANGNDTTYQTYVIDLSKRALDLMGNGIKDMQVRVETITRAANELIANLMANPAPGQMAQQPTYHKRGLDYRNTNELKDIISTSQKIESAAQDFANLSKAVAAGFKEVGDNASKTEHAADQTLNADYSGAFSGRR